jgi:hypothetical protein
VDDRKYRQQGYKAFGADRDRRDRQPRPRASSFGPGPAMPPSRTVSRCAQCGTLLPPLAEPTAACPKCGLVLHSCRQCSHFDPGRRFECAQPVPERLADKDARNECGFFSLRTNLERDTSSGAMAARAPAPPAPGPTPAADARQAFDNLFKK